MSNINKYKIIDLNIKACNQENTYADHIYEIDPIIFTNNYKRMNNFNIIGEKLVYSIPYNLTIHFIQDGSLLTSKLFNQGIYTENELITLFTTNTGLVLDNCCNNKKFKVADISKLFSIRFDIKDDDLISTMLGLDQISTNISGNLITYNLPVSGKFPYNYNLTLFKNADIKFGFADINTNIQDHSLVNLVPITNKTMYSFDMNSNYWNSFSNDSENQEFCFSLPDNLNSIKYIRVRLSTTFEDQVIWNLNPLKLRLCIDYQ